MTDLELIALFTAGWIGAAAIWMMLDWAVRPKHSRFVVKGDRIGRGIFAYHHFRRVRRAEENEETRLLLESRYATPTLALSRKRRNRVQSRHDQPINPSPAPPTAQHWIELADSPAGFGVANRELLMSGQPAVRYNSVLGVDETMMLLPDGVAAWPSLALDPFSAKRLADLDDRDPGRSTPHTEAGERLREVGDSSRRLEQFREAG